MTEHLAEGAASAPPTAVIERPAGLVRHHISAEPPPLGQRLRELLASRDLFLLLLARELRVRYKQTALGVIWVVLQPLVPALIFAVVFGTFAKLPSSGAPYLLFAASGLVIFGLFSSAASRAATSFIRDAPLITKVYFPRAILPVAAGSAALIDFAVGLVVVLILMATLGIIPGPAVLTIPMITFATVAIGLALGLALAALGAWYRDFALAVPFLLQVALYASPVVYSSELVPEPWRFLYALNPLVALVEGFRWALLGTPAPTLVTVAAALVTGSVAVVVSALVFTRASRDLSDVI